MESKYILAYKLKAYRVKNDLTQEEFAEKTGLSTRCCGKVERCEVSTTLDTLDKIAAAIGLTTSELLREV